MSALLRNTRHRRGALVAALAGASAGALALASPAGAAATAT
ncbi:MAG: hypothetical protein QOJ92_1285, partial [Frankiales bacterium]|nr:hypothetical protein [Frankiales bacterium]